MGVEIVGDDRPRRCRRPAATCTRRGWQLVEVAEEAGLSAEERKRPGSKEALRVLESGDGTTLVARKLDKPARSLLELARLLESAQKQGFALVALDCAAETTTPAGQAAVRVLASFAPYERGLHSQRIRQALAAKRAQGVRLGRPPSMSHYASEPRVRAWPRSRRDSTRIASPPRRVAPAGTRPPCATRSSAHSDALASSPFAGSATLGCETASRCVREARLFLVSVGFVDGAG